MLGMHSWHCLVEMESQLVVVEVRNCWSVRTPHSADSSFSSAPASPRASLSYRAEIATRQKKRQKEEKTRRREEHATEKKQRTCVKGNEEGTESNRSLYFASFFLMLPSSLAQSIYFF